MTWRLTLVFAIAAVAATSKTGMAAEVPPVERAPQAATAAAAPSLTSNGWQFLVAPYMWGINTSGDLTIGPFSSSFQIPLSTALDELDAAFEVHGEVRKDRVALVLDYTYFNLQKDNAFSVMPPVGPPVGGNLDMRIQFFEAWPYYRLGDDDNAFDVLAGLRYDSFRTKIEAPSIGASDSRQINWTDPIVGARWIGRVKPRLFLVARADVGGFGAGSRYTVNVLGGVEWQFSHLAGLVVEYRWMKISYEEGSGPTLFKFTPSMHGVVLGVPFVW